MSSANFWKILGIEPTTERSEIKKAYHQKLPLHHPEDDPEGFQLLRAAFDEAIAFAESHTHAHQKASRNEEDAPAQTIEYSTTEEHTEKISPQAPDSNLNDFEIDRTQILRRIYQQGVFHPDFSDALLYDLNAKYRWTEDTANIHAEFGEAFTGALRVRLDRELDNDSDSRIRRIEKLYAQNDLYEALNILMIYLERYPNEASLQLLSIRLYYDMGHYAQVLQQLDMLETKKENEELTIYRVSAETCLYGMNEERLAKLENLVRKVKRATVAHELLRFYYWELQLWKKMLYVADILARTAPSVHNISCRGVALSGARKEKAAKKDFHYVAAQLQEKEKHGLLNAEESSALAYAYYHFGFWQLGTFWGLRAGERKDLHGAMGNVVFGIRVKPTFHSLYELVLEICGRSDAVMIPEEVAWHAENDLAPNHPELTEKVLALYAKQQESSGL